MTTRNLRTLAASLTPEQRAELRALLAEERPLPVLPRVVTAAEYGARGALAQRERYGLAQLRAWGRMGGRPRDPRYTGAPGPERAG